jgi:hypothetical protein
MVKLVVDYADYKAALYACKNWHYSKAIPAGKTYKIGVWEDDIYKGVVIFSRGANPHTGSPYGLKQTEVCELTRIALRSHKSFVSQVMAIAIRKLKQDNPGMRLIVSYADSAQGHEGKIYQANNWIYTGYSSSSESGILVHGKLTHRRSLGMRYGTSNLEWLRNNIDPNAEVINGGYKYKYLYPLDKKIRKQIITLSKTYPKSSV